MRNRELTAVLVVLASTTLCAQSASAPRPPVAAKIHVEKPINGSVLTDDYGWLREKTTPRVREYLEAENAYADLERSRDDRYLLMVRQVQTQ